MNHFITTSLVVHANLTLLLLFSQRHIDVETQTAPEPSGARLATGAKPAARGRCVFGADGTLRRAVRAGDLCLEAERVPDQLRFRLRVRRPHVFQRVLGVIPAAGRSPLTSSRITASVWSSWTCHAALPWIRPPSVLPAAGRSYRFSLPTAMGLERRRPRPGTPSLSVLAVLYLLRSVKDEKQPGALPTSR